MKKGPAEWLPGWSVVVIPALPGERSVYERYKTECETMRYAGKRIFKLGSLFRMKGAAKGPFANGTGGNLAAVCAYLREKIVVTAMDAHKGELRKNDFVEVARIDEAKKVIYIRRDRKNALPSRDAPLIARVFAGCPHLNFWIHFHKAVDTPHAIRLARPADDAGEWDALAALFRGEARIVNVIDHDLSPEAAATGTKNAAIIVGEDAMATVTNAIKLACRSST